MLKKLTDDKLKTLLVVVSIISSCAALLFGCALLGRASDTSGAQVAEGLREVTRVVTREVTREVAVEGAVPAEVTVVVERVITATPPPATATPRATVTPTPTPTPDAPRLGTRQNPVPLYETLAMIKDGRIHFEVSIVELHRGEAAMGIVRRANQFNDPPTAGFEFVAVLIEVAYTGPDAGTLQLGRRDLSVVTLGRVVSYFNQGSRPCCLTPDFDFELLSDGRGQGWRVFEVDVIDTTPLMQLGDAYFALYGTD
jgi:hypothetical protein